MAIHDVTASLSASAGIRNLLSAQKMNAIEYIVLKNGVPVDTAQTNAAYEYLYLGVSAYNENTAGGEFIYGEINNYLIGTASLTASAYVRNIRVQGYSVAVDTDTTLLSIPYPDNTDTEDLILAFTGGKSEAYVPWSTTFNRGVTTWNSFTSNTSDYAYYSDPLAENAGRVNANVFQRIIPEGQTGTIDFTLPTPNTDYVHVGRSLRLVKSSYGTWNVQHYNTSYHYANANQTTLYAGKFGRVHPFLQTSATVVSTTAAGWDGKNLWVCGSNDGRIAYSINGSIWEIATTTPFTSSDQMWFMVYGAGKFICTTTNNKMAWSTDGKTWTSITSPFTGNGPTNIAWNGEYFLASNSNYVAKSLNGTTWTMKNVGSSITLTRPIYGDGMWIVSERNNATTHYFYYSTDDGETWTKQSLGDNVTYTYYSQYVDNNIYGKTPDGRSLWIWTGSFAWGQALTTDPINGPYRYDVYDGNYYRTPFSTYWDSTGGQYFYSVYNGSSDGNINYFHSSTSSVAWRGTSTNTPYVNWSVVADHTRESRSPIEAHIDYGVNIPVYAKDRWILPYASNGLCSYFVSSSGVDRMDLLPGDILIFHLVTPYDYTVGIYDINTPGITISNVIWLPAYHTTTGGNASQYIGYAYVLEGTSTGYFAISFMTDKINDRSSSLTISRVRSEIIPIETKVIAALDVSAVVLKTECVASASLTADAFLEKAPTYGMNIGSVWNEVSGNSITLATTAIAANTLLVLSYASDNYTGALPTITVTDNFGGGSGSWAVHGYARQGSAAAGGVTSATASKYLLTSVPTGSTITVILSNAVKAKGFRVMSFNNFFNSTTATTTAIGSTSTPSIQHNTSTMSALVGMVGWEHDTVCATGPAGPWTGTSYFGTGTGGNAATHIYQASSYRIIGAPATTATYSLGLAGNYDWGGIITEFMSGHQTGLIMRITPTLSATADVLVAKRATQETYVSAEMEVIGEYIPTTGEVVTGQIQSELSGTASIGHFDTSSLSVYGELQAVGLVPEIHNAVVMDMAATFGTVSGYLIEASVAAMIAEANTMLTPVIDIDTPPVIITPPPPPEGDETWGSHSGEEPTMEPLPPGGGFGNIIEITNRTYSPLYVTQRRYRADGVTQETPYQMQAMQGKVADIGGGRALCMHVQENSWYVGKFVDAPAMLVATVVNAGTPAYPSVISQRRYELPLVMRGFATTDSTICELDDGGVIYTVTGMVFADLITDPVSTAGGLSDLQASGGTFAHSTWDLSSSLINGNVYVAYGIAPDENTWTVPSGWTVELLNQAVGSSRVFFAWTRYNGTQGTVFSRTGNTNDPGWQCVFNWSGYDEVPLDVSPVYTFISSGSSSSINVPANWLWGETGRAQVFASSGQTIYSSVNNANPSTTGSTKIISRGDDGSHTVDFYTGYDNSTPLVCDYFVYNYAFKSSSLDTISLDEGHLAFDTYKVPGPITIAARIDVDGAGHISYTWVKKWGAVGYFEPSETHGGEWTGIHWGLLHVLDGYPIYQTISAYFVNFLKIDPATGAWVEVSNTAQTTGQFSVAITDGSNVTLLHENYYPGNTFYTSGSLDPLSIDVVTEADSSNVLMYNGRYFVASLYRLGWYPNSYVTIGWLGNTSTAEWSSSRSEAHLFEWAWDEEGTPYIRTTYMADNVITDDLRGPGHGNVYATLSDRWYDDYCVAEDDVTPWVYYYGDPNGDTSSTNWLTAVRTGSTYSYVYLTNEIGTMTRGINPTVERSMGVHCTYKLEEADDDGKAVAWYTPPVGNATWDSYFWKTRDHAYSYAWYCNTHAQTLRNGNIVVFLTATNNRLVAEPLDTEWADQWENGETRAFVTIIEGGEAPPLKMTQRDDDKRDGAARIGYIPVNGDSQRISSQTY